YIAEHVRLEPGKNGKSKDYLWFVHGTAGLGGRKVTELPLYGVHELGQPGEASSVIVVEGEKARDALGARAILAVATVTGASSTPDDSVLSVLRGFDVVLWPDADEPGRQHMRRIGQRLHALGIVYRVLAPWPDASDGRDAADLQDDSEA